MEDIFDVIDRVLTEAGYKKTVNETKGTVRYECENSDSTFQE